MSLSAVIGRSRTRVPVAWYTAFAIAAAAPVMQPYLRPLGHLILQSAFTDFSVGTSYATFTSTR